MYPLICFARQEFPKPRWPPQHRSAFLRRPRTTHPLLAGHPPAALWSPLVRRRSAQRTAYSFCKCQPIPCTPVLCPHKPIPSRPLRTPHSSPSSFWFLILFNFVRSGMPPSTSQPIASPIYSRRGPSSYFVCRPTATVSNICCLAATGKARASNNYRSISLKVACKPTPSRIGLVHTPTFHSLRTSRPLAILTAALSWRPRSTLCRRRFSIIVHTSAKPSFTTRFTLTARARWSYLVSSASQVCSTVVHSTS